MVGKLSIFLFKRFLLGDKLVFGVYLFFFCLVHFFGNTSGLLETKLIHFLVGWASSEVDWNDNTKWHHLGVYVSCFRAILKHPRKKWHRTIPCIFYCTYVHHLTLNTKIVWFCLFFDQNRQWSKPHLMKLKLKVKTNQTLVSCRINPTHHKNWKNRSFLGIKTKKNQTKHPSFHPWFLLRSAHISTMANPGVPYGPPKMCPGRGNQVMKNGRLCLLWKGGVEVTHGWIPLDKKTKQTYATDFWTIWDFGGFSLWRFLVIHPQKLI